MKRNIIISIVLIVVFAACSKEVYEKPKDLIREKIMINILTDVHLAEAIFFNQDYIINASLDTTHSAPRVQWARCFTACWELSAKQQVQIPLLATFPKSNNVHWETAPVASPIKRLTSTDLYYSVLHKYNVSDSTFERSFVYYASKPKSFEKMYREVVNNLTEIEEEQRTLRNKLLELEMEEQKRLEQEKAEQERLEQERLEPESSEQEM